MKKLILVLCVWMSGAIFAGCNPDIAFCYNGECSDNTETEEGAGEG